MKNKIVTPVCSLLLMASLLGACSPQTSMTSNAPIVKTEAQANLSEADLKIKVKALMTKADQDEDFSEKLNANPKVVLAEEGLKVAEDDQVKVLEYTPDSIYMILDDRNLQQFYPQLTNASTVEQNETQKLFTSIRAKANTDANFKAKLISSTAVTLESEGVPAEAAKKFTVQDYEANTHYFLVVPSEQPITRGRELARFEAIINTGISTIEPIMRKIVGDGIEFMVNVPLETFRLAKDAKSVAIKTYVRDVYPPQLSITTDTAYFAIEGICYVPRNWFGDSGCQASKADLRKAIDDRLREGPFGNAIRAVHGGN